MCVCVCDVILTTMKSPEQGNVAKNNFFIARNVFLLVCSKIFVAVQAHGEWNMSSWASECKRPKPFDTTDYISTVLHDRLQTQDFLLHGTT